MRYVHFDIHEMREDPRFGRWYRQVHSQPPWVWRIALVAALVVVVLPIVALALAAMVTFILIFAVLLLAHRIGTFFSSLVPGGRPRPDVERRNVRVLHPRDE